MNKTIRIVLIILLIFMLIAVRAFLEPYFYDPLLDYFKSDYLKSSIPKLDLTNYFSHIFYRYTINTLLSLASIYLIFNKLDILKFSIKFYIFAFILLSLTLLVLLKYQLSNGYILIFYVRRFLIQPLFLLILIPAFYYREKLKVIKKEAKNTSNR